MIETKWEEDKGTFTKWEKKQELSSVQKTDLVSTLNTQKTRINNLLKLGEDTLQEIPRGRQEQTITSLLNEKKDKIDAQLIELGNLQISIMEK